MRQYVNNLFQLMQEARRRRLQYVEYYQQALYQIADVMRNEDSESDGFGGFLEFMEGFGDMLSHFESGVLEPQREELIHAFSLLALIKDKAIMALFGPESILPLQKSKSCILSMSYIGCSLLSILYMDRSPHK